MTEDELVGWHHRLDGYEFEQTLGVDDGQGIMACCGPWGCEESDTTEQLSSTDTPCWWVAARSNCFLSGHLEMSGFILIVTAGERAVELLVSVSHGSVLHLVKPLLGNLLQTQVAKSLQSCPTLCDPVNCSPPSSSVHGFLQERMLEWVAIFFSRESFQARD